MEERLSCRKNSVEVPTDFQSSFGNRYSNFSWSRPFEHNKKKSQRLVPELVWCYLEYFVLTIDDGLQF